MTQIPWWQSTDMNRQLTEEETQMIIIYMEDIIILTNN